MSYVVNEDGVSFEDASLVYVRDKHGILKSTPEYENPRRVDVLREYHLVYGNIYLKIEAKMQNQNHFE